jgi:hypothetical protein
MPAGAACSDAAPAGAALRLRLPELLAAGAADRARAGGGGALAEDAWSLTGAIGSGLPARASSACAVTQTGVCAPVRE